jgi:hypothetical protein
VAPSFGVELSPVDVRDAGEIECVVTAFAQRRRNRRRRHQKKSYTKPQSEVECALAIQMACTHTAAMAVLNRLGGGHGTERSVAAMVRSQQLCLRQMPTKRNHRICGGF